MKQSFVCSRIPLVHVLGVVMLKEPIGGMLNVNVMLGHDVSVKVVPAEVDRVRLILLHELGPWIAGGETISVQNASVRIMDELRESGDWK